MADGAVFACLYLSSPSVQVMEHVLDQVCPPLEEPGPRVLTQRYGACQAFVLVPQATASTTYMPRLVREAADLAYSLGATRVEYINEAMAEIRAPRLLQRRGSM